MDGLAAIDAALAELQAEAVRIRDAMLRVAAGAPSAEVSPAERAAVAAASQDIERLGARLEALHRALRALPSERTTEGASDHTDR